MLLAVIDADYWKSWVHQRLTALLGSPGAMTLFQAKPNDHLSLAKHLTAESKTEEFIVGKGVVTKWERKHRNNHWFDATYYACVAGHYSGVRLVDEQPKTKQRLSLEQYYQRANPGARPSARAIAEMTRRRGG